MTGCPSWMGLAGKVHGCDWTEPHPGHAHHNHQAGATWTGATWRDLAALRAEYSVVRHHPIRYLAPCPPGHYGGNMGTERKTYSVVFAGAVLDLMRTTGTSENQLSIATEIPRATLSRRLRGARWSTPEMEAIAQHFGRSVSAVCAHGEELAERDGAA